VRFSTAIQLGRVSNLPTVWTNTLAAFAFVSATPSGFYLFVALLTFSLFYLGGMFFNDAFDAQWDREHDIQRPIVKGETDVREVSYFAIAFFFSALCLLLIIAEPSQKMATFFAAIALISGILLYDWKHKQWAHSAWLMGACRLLLYLSAALLIAPANLLLWLAGLSLMAYIAGITYLARSEHLNQLYQNWPILLLLTPSLLAIVLLFYIGPALIPALMIAATLLWLFKAIRKLLPGEQRNVPQAIGALLAGLCLIDASFLLVLNQTGFGVLAIFAFLLCLLLQRKIAAS